MAHNIILAERTQKELGFEVGSILAVDAVNDQRSVFMKCSDCGDEFIRPLRLLYANHSCGGGGGRRCTAHHPDLRLPRLECKLVHKDAKYPYRKRATDAGYDIFSVKKVKVPPFATRKVPTGIKLVCPEGFYYTIEGRSSLWKRGVMPYRGIIDAGYTGDTCVFMINATPQAYVFNVGDKVAQILLHRVNDFDISPVPKRKRFSRDYIIRGEEGFGSSGR